MYALPAVHKSAKLAPATSGKKDMLAGGAVVSALVLGGLAGKWIGNQLGDFVIWLIDEEYYWEDQIKQHQTAIDAAQAKLTEIQSARSAAEHHDAEAVIE